MGWSDDSAKDFKSWQGEWDGCMMCACDHGCNQWLVKNQSKASLVMRVLSSKGSTKLDKIVQMSNQKANKIWFWIHMRENKKFNEELRREERRQGLEIIARIGYDKIKAAWEPKWEEGQPSATGRRKLAAEALGLTRTELSMAYFAGKPEQE